MKLQSKSGTRLPSQSGQETDGRRQRSTSSRAKIVQAMLDLVGAGTVAPSAMEIAEQAGVGLRSVFRHFDDMDSLYREMSDAIEAKVMPIVLKPLQATHWKAQVCELVNRRANVFEIILPFRISANIKRYQSPFLMQDYRRMLMLERGAVEAVLPLSLASNQRATNALVAALSFQVWRLLRHDEGLPAAQCEAVVLTMIHAILAQLDDV